MSRGSASVRRTVCGWRERILLLFSLNGFFQCLFAVLFFLIQCFSQWQPGTFPNRAEVKATFE